MELNDFLDEIDKRAKLYIINSNNKKILSNESLLTDYYQRTLNEYNTYNKIFTEKDTYKNKSKKKYNKNFCSLTVSEPIENKFMYKIQFKHSFMYCELGYDDEYNIKDYVITKDFHGENLGMIVDVVKPSNINNNDICSIMRLAESDELNLLDDKYHDENLLFNYSKQFVNNNSNLEPLKIIDVEYQFDRKILKIFYSTKMRVDYRQLLRYLQTICRCHVKMIRIINDTFVPYNLI